jgi:mannose-6-phosphate isomerase
MSARAIEPKFVEKVWGSKHLEPWFPDRQEKTGEVWFPAGELLIKFLFTTEDLSVQVHPNDAYAREYEHSRGKTEMWHILRAEPGALARSGVIVDRLAWFACEPGDTFFVPAGTVHAIGRGLALCEIQQNSDVTYRLYDYGRPRELHLEKSLDVAKVGKHPGALRSRDAEDGRELLVKGQYFETEKLTVAGAREVPEGYAVILEGDGTIDGEPFRQGTVWEVEGTATAQADTPATLLTTRVPNLRE